ncbi:hypothetical protein [Streptomyces mirabilis]|uniref:hypothetical protein n=1 Tax=Streptomyces mirabilis TaxID=68239 RepID=UPI00343AAE50
MMTGVNRRFRLAARPVGAFKDSDFELAETPVPVPGEGELLVKVTHLSIDPAMRGWMNAGLVTPAEVGAVMRAITIGNSPCRTERGSTKSTLRRAGRSRYLSASWE